MPQDSNFFAYDGDSQAATPHTGVVNALFCDGSVRTLKADYNPYVTVDYTETIRPMESHDDGGIIIDFFPTETIRPIESVQHFELLI